MKQTKRPRILLVSLKTDWVYSSIGLDQMAGYLRQKGYCVDMLYHHTLLKTEDVMSAIKPGYDVYGFSVTTENYNCCFEVASLLRVQQPLAYVVFGGAWASRYYQELYDKGCTAHYLVLGDGEIPMENLLRHLFEGERLQTGEHIASPGDTQGKSMYYNKTIDWLPIFDYYTGYLPQKNGNKIYCLQSKNNICTGNCSFCPGRRGRCQYKADSQIVREISHVANSYGVVNFFFTDDNLFDPDNRMAKDRLKGLCLAIKAANLKKIKFSCYAKAISLRDCPEDRELLLLMKETGFIAIFIGIEAGNEADLLLYRKRATVADNYRSIEMLREAGIMPLMGFINFNPYSTKQTLKENYDFLLAVDPQNLVDSFAKALIVYKYTGIYDKLQRDGLLIDGYEYLDEATRWQFLDPSVKTIHDTVEKKLFPLFTNFNKEYQKSLASFNFHKKLNKNAARFEGQFEVVYQGQIDAINAYLAKLIENGDEAGFRELDQACHRSTARLRQLDMAMFGIDIPLE